jgi:hypothetical protein
MDSALQEEQIRKRAYELWEEDGSPEGRADEYWEKARASIDPETAESVTETSTEPGEPVSE